MNGKISESFKSMRGLKQENPALLILVNLALKRIIRGNALWRTEMIHRRRHQILTYTDDIGSASRTIKELCLKVRNEFNRVD